MKNLKSIFGLLSFICLLLLSSTTTNAQQAKDSQYEIAPTEYADLNEKMLQYIEQFAFSDWYEMMSDDVEYYLPDGGEKTRTSLIGKKAVMEFWDSYQEKSGNDKMVVSNTVHAPLIVKSELNYTKITGVVVLSYFSVKFSYGAEEVDIRMNWGVHYNADKKIDKIYTYYDRTPIIAAAKRNFLSKAKE